MGVLVQHILGTSTWAWGTVRPTCIRFVRLGSEGVQRGRLLEVIEIQTVLVPRRVSTPRNALKMRVDDNTK